MRDRDIEKKRIKNWHYYIKFINISFFLISLFSLSLFAFYENITRIIFSPNKLDIVTQDLHDIALYFQYYDTDVRDRLLTVDDIIKSYEKGENIFETKAKELNESLEFIKNNKEYLLEIGFDKYNNLLSIFIDLINNQEEVFDLLGKNGEKNYMVILQNAAEKRPNGGFYGSFAFVSIKNGVIQNLEIIDSYYPQRIGPEIRVNLPERSHKIINAESIGFLSSNKFGFTTTDGHNIKTLYDKTFSDPSVYQKKIDVIEPGLFDKTFNKTVAGVIFIRSDLLTDLLPELEPKLRERQFVNANIDLIRGANLPDKKALYKKELEDFFNENKGKLIKNLIKDFDKIISYHFINIYIENSSKQLKEVLKKNKLTTNYDPNNIYIWDNNAAYNKIDNFVDKKTTIVDDNDIIVSSSNHDIINIENLGPGEYTLKISYTLKVPTEYMEYIKSLQSQYGVTMGSREKGILGIEPTVHYRTFEEKRWATKSHVYFPPSTSIIKLGGDIKNSMEFYPPFAQGLYFESQINNTNNTTNNIYIKFKLKNND